LWIAVALAFFAERRDSGKEWRRLGWRLSA
jgi:hypothetical protein